MRAIVIISAILGLSLANQIDNADNKIVLKEEVLQQFKEEYEENVRLGDEAVIAVMNDFVDKLFDNIGPFAISHGFDPIPLSDMKQKYLIAEIDLTEGQIQGVSTIHRYKDVKATYSSGNKTVVLDIPIAFSNLSFTYDYGIQITIMHDQGSLTGVIKDFKIDLQLAFDFDTLTASIQKLKTKDTGKISVIISGHGITDQIVNILSQFVSDILHPILALVIEGIMRTVANNLVDSVNDIIQSILQPNSTLLYDYIALNSK